MIKRKDIIARAIANTPWHNWRAHPIAADASTRAYVRLIGPNAHSVILMDANPETDPSFSDFLRVDDHLRQAGLAAPEIKFVDAELGIAILEDLGANDFAKWTAKTPSDTHTLYGAAVDLLTQINAMPPPSDLAIIDPLMAGNMVAETIDWYADCDAVALASAITQSYQDLTFGPPIMALRDFHAENLIWRPDQAGTTRVGLLDFQDAILAPAGYDLMSLLRDVRRDIEPNLVAEMITEFAAKTHQPADQFAAQCACISAQRNLRILGVFARLIQRDGKTKYTAFIDRVWAHIMTDVAHPALKDLAGFVRLTLPPPAKSKLSEAL